MGNRIFFISLISRENRPLHIQEVEPLRGEEGILSDRIDEQTGVSDPITTTTEKRPTNSTAINDSLKYHFLSNMALDVFLSPLYTGGPGIPTLMFVQDGVNVYGYETNTGLKILVGTASQIDGSFEYVFKSMHRIYVALVVNPFQNEDISELKINEKSMRTKIIKVVDTWKQKLSSA